MTALSAVDRFLTAFYAGDIDAARETITPDFTLDGPFASANSADELFRLAEGVLRIVRGHKVLRHVVEDGTVAVLYDLMLQGPAGQGALTVSGWFTTVDGHVSSGRLIYDSAAFDAIVSSS
jgi:SnoaL-like domain